MNKFNHLHFKPFINKIHCLAGVFICCFSIPSCIFNEDRITSEIADIEVDIAAKDYNSAQNKLKKYSSLHDDFIYQYNRAVISIFSGNCKKAKNDLETMLAELESKEDKTEQNAIMSFNNKQNQFNGQIHLAIAVADLCQDQSDSEQPTPIYEDALAHLYTASSYGIELNDAILEVIQRWIPKCSSYIEQWQIPANIPEQALDLASIQNRALTVCTDGVWLKLDARNHETISSSISIAPLERQVWLDDSSKLPFSQLQIDVFDHIPSENDKPIAHFSQPLPKTLPPGEAYKSQSFTLKDFIFEEDSTHFIHLYTYNQGELKLQFSYKKNANCEFLDDLKTYTPELQPHVTELVPNERVGDLLLCPNRPDQFIFALDSQQYALITLDEQLNRRESSLPFISPQIKLLDARGKILYDSTAISRNNSGQKTEVSWFNIKMDELNDNPSQEMYNEFILIYNNSDVPVTYTLDLYLPDEVQSIEYGVSLSLSQECSKNGQERVFPIQLANIEQSHQIHFPPVWICPKDSVTYQPVLPSNQQLLRTRVEHTFVSDTHIRPDDIDFTSYLNVESNHNLFLVEHAQDAPSLWENEALIRNEILLKPITPNTIFKLDASMDSLGFSLITVSLNDDENSPDDSKESKEDSEKNDHKDQHDETQKQDSPNQSPDKPSETPATAKGAGEDAQGKDSTPDEQASGDNASKLDMQQYERDQIDDLLDSIEKGHYFVPLSGKMEEPQSDKDW